MAKEAKKVLTAAETNDLPDSSFAIVLPGGTKDSGGKTVPRSLRKLPYKDSGGKLMPEQAFAAIQVLNGAKGGVDAPKAAKIAAWNKIVRAIKAERKDWVPPPRKF